MLLLSLISGLFSDSIIYVGIIFIHEMGHFLCAKLFKWNVDKIYFYLYGGYTKFNDQINRPLYQELLIMLSGPVVQTVFFFLLKDVIPIKYASSFIKYNYSILLFNLLPIYPLDGGKLINIICSYFFSYKRSLTISLYVSYLFIWFVAIVSIFNKTSITLSLLMVIMVVVIKLKEEFDKRPYYINKFFLERFLYPTTYKKVITISKLDEMHRDKKHLVKSKDKLLTEREALKRKFVEYT